MTKRIPAHGTPRYFVREVDTPCEVRPFRVVFRDTGEEVEGYDDYTSAAKRATFLIRRRQNAGKKPVAKLNAVAGTVSVFNVGSQRVTVVSTTYACTCSASAGLLGCKHIDAVKALPDNA